MAVFMFVIRGRTSNIFRPQIRKVSFPVLPDSFFSVFRSEIVYYCPEEWSAKINSYEVCMPSATSLFRPSKIFFRPKNRKERIWEVRKTYFSDPRSEKYLTRPENEVHKSTRVFACASPRTRKPHTSWLSYFTLQGSNILLNLCSSFEVLLRSS